MLRRSPRVLGLWAGAALLAITTGSVVAGDLATLHRRAGDLGPEAPVVVARASLPLGATVTLADVGTRRVHTSQTPEGVLRHVDEAVGRIVRVPVVRGGYVHAEHLAPRRRDRLTSVLPPDSRAVRVAVDGGLRPPRGSAVDVYVTDTSGSDALGTGRFAGAGTVVAAAGAVVLDRTSDSVTLLVDEDQAATLAGASARGTLFLALVPPEDARMPAALMPR